MRFVFKPVAVLLVPALLMGSPAFAQQARVVDGAALQAALDGQADAEARQRALVARVLDHDDARRIAARLGLDVTRAQAAVATLAGAELRQAAEQAGAVETARAGGQARIVISLTTLLLILIIVILLAN